MGNAFACISSSSSSQEATRKKAEKNSKPEIFSDGKDGLLQSFSSASSSSKRQKDEVVDEVILEEAIAAAMLFRQHQKNGSFPFPRSNSQHQGSINKSQALPRSFTSRQSSLPDSPFLPPIQDIKVEELGSKHFILVHGGGFGAWCWYKIITLLEESGFKVDAVDLKSHPHSNTFSEYTKPLIDILQNLKDEEKVILVGHDIGGACLSYVMELFPGKIDKSIFISATMLSNGQSALHILSQQTDSSDLMKEAYVFVYGNGNDNPPTAIDLNKDILRDLLFNKSSNKDIALALVSMRGIPFSAIVEKVVISEKKYGSVPRFYIKTEQDCAIPESLQEEMIKSNPPQQVFQLKASDHAPFFSKPQALHRLLLHISTIPSSISA
ncbi:methyl esterase 11 [Euphorbia peplus]|nr:methyl esterase 11 [Euphorbia peplus]